MKDGGWVVGWLVGMRRREEECTWRGSEDVRKDGKKSQIAKREGGKEEDQGSQCRTERREREERRSGGGGKEERKAGV